MGTATIKPSREGLLPEDVLTAIFAMAKELSGEDRLAFRGHDPTLQKVFRTLAEELHSRALDGFVFSDSGPEPYSPVLSESISRLQLSGLLGRENPDYEVVFLRRSADEYFNRELKPRLSDGEAKELSSLAQRFLQLVTRA